MGKLIVIENWQEAKREYRLRRAARLRVGLAKSIGNSTKTEVAAAVGMSPVCDHAPSSDDLMEQFMEQSGRPDVLIDGASEEEIAVLRDLVERLHQGIKEGDVYTREEAAALGIEVIRRLGLLRAA